MRPRTSVAVAVAVAVSAAVGAAVASAVIAQQGSTLATLEPAIMLLATAPRLYRMRALLSAEECAALVALGEPRLVRSEVGAAEGATESHPAGTLSGWRNSSTLYLDQPADAAHPLVRVLRRRLADAARLPEAHAEPLQLARYGTSESYGLHLDVDPRGAAPRYATILVYLSDDFEGGHTVFPRVPAAPGRGARGALRPLSKLAAAGGETLLLRELELRRWCDDDDSAVLRAPPAVGDALLFFSMRPDAAVDEDAVHGGCPPRGGTKWVAQQWFTLDPSHTADAPDVPLEGPESRPVPAARGGEMQARALSERALRRMREEMAGAAGRAASVTATHYTVAR